jgi:hypothetical protein
VNVFPSTFVGVGTDNYPCTCICFIYFIAFYFLLPDQKKVTKENQTHPEASGNSTGRSGGRKETVKFFCINYIRTICELSDKRYMPYIHMFLVMKICEIDTVNIGITLNR